MSQTPKRTLSAAEVTARIDAVLDDCSTGQTCSDPNGRADRVDNTIDPESVDTPIGVDTNWQEIARTAWEALTGEAELPGWFDDLTTIGEMARKSGKEREEVKAALDAAPQNAVTLTWSIDESGRIRASGSGIAVRLGIEIPEPGQMGLLEPATRRDVERIQGHAIVGEAGPELVVFEGQTIFVTLFRP